jgi:uncharacterized membrane protein YhhN
MKQPLQYGLIFLYVVVCTLQLIACAQPKLFRLRRLTKCLLMPVLALCYVACARTFSALVLIGILCGFVGDALLLHPENPTRFAGGLAAFAVGHICYAIHMLLLRSAAPAWWVTAIAIALYMALIWLIMSKLRRDLPQSFVVPCLAYMLVICLMSFAALLLLINWRTINAALLFIGSLLFMVSDTVLAFDTFRTRPVRHGGILIMGTYILAQTLIVCGLLFM